MPGVSNTPWMGTISLPLANTAYQLSARLLALPEDQRPQFTNVPKTQAIAIQANPENSTGAKYYIGNSFVTSSNRGIQLFATQVWPIYSMESNLIRLDHIWVMCDTADETMNVTMVTR